MENSVEERLVNVRRTLLVDRPAASTSGISGVSAMDREESSKVLLNSSLMKERMALIEQLVGLAKVHKAK
jgi:hypothetical protein